ncbi:M18 family aminopeptidase [uncultured Flavonifractor sp.]|uniref:M18 family aminopeptidase n=1 Tax=uncultured Flavonifractor sp. TaxID=1193534 RepID=UPI002615DA45|nr:M18 family aminopeptidase [uncultured Flavonifractor sp.]
MNTLQRLMDFIARSPSPYHAVHTAASLLDEAGFTRLEECASWALEPGKGYYTTRNQSSLIAFRLPLETVTGWRMTAAHSDSPTFYIKGDVLEGDKRYLRLSAEDYGGMNRASWMDRPLTVAGRAIVKTRDGVESRLVYLDRDLLTIPSLAIHQQRDVNKGHDYNAQKDMQPLYGLAGSPSLTQLVAQALGVSEEDILSTDLTLCPRQQPVVLGPAGELFQAPRIDDLGCAYATLEGFLAAAPQKNAGQVYCLFDNEEVGSGTRQGALSSFLPDVLARIAHVLALDPQQTRQALAGSMLLSADNGHAVHPNFTEKADPANKVYPNGGVVVKLSASQKYTTTGLTAGLFRAICQKAGVPVQVFANRADEPGGSTLGNLLSHAVSIPMVDIGMAQLAMHSAVETGGSQDPEYLSQACAAFFQTAFSLTADGAYQFI